VVAKRDFSQFPPSLFEIFRTQEFKRAVACSQGTAPWQHDTLDKYLF
jgi:hypothetical protein